MQQIDSVIQELETFRSLYFQKTDFADKNKFERLLAATSLNLSKLNRFKPPEFVSIPIRPKRERGRPTQVTSDFNLAPADLFELSNYNIDFQEEPNLGEAAAAIPKSMARER